MLSQQDNEILTRVGPGTLMGNLLRRYWMPALLSLELPEPDCPPVRVRLLARTSSPSATPPAASGCSRNACPHRGASMFFGRNEEDGLRCVYHGWKFDIDRRLRRHAVRAGRIATSRTRCALPRYPTHESDGLVWAYMGPPETMQPFRDLGFDAVASSGPPRSVLSECNWVQALEGNLDTSHISYLHRNLPTLAAWRRRHGPARRTRPTSMSTFIRAHDRAPRVEVQDTWYGFRYAGIRTTPAGYTHVRMTEFILPFTTRVAQIPLSNNFGLGSMVPIDDYNCWRGAIVPGGPRAEQAGMSDNKVPKGGVAPRTQNATNDFLIDREKQKTFSYTGIVGINQQDMAVTESMGAIYQRHQEHLGTTDRAIIKLRRMLIDAAKNLAKGIEPPTADPALPLEKVRSAERIITTRRGLARPGYRQGPALQGDGAGCYTRRQQLVRGQVLHRDECS